MKILKVCKRFLSFAGLGADEYVNIGGKNVPRMLIRAIYTAMLLTLSTINMIRCFMAYPIGPQAMLYPVLCFTLDMDKFAVYRVLLYNTDRIAELINYLEAVVERRMFISRVSLIHRSWSYNLNVFGIHWIVFFFISNIWANLGCNLSSTSETSYAKRNSYDKQIVWGIAIMLSQLVVSAYAPPVLCWMSTLIFGVPSKEYWILPVGTDEA